MAGSTNLLQHNPSVANQDTDAQYSADELRSGGIGFGNIIASKFLNKVLYQCSTVAAALGQALANLGYNVSDSNLSGLTANLTTALSTAPKVVQITAGATTTLDCSQANQLFAYFEVTLSQNLTFTVANQKPGQMICIAWISTTGTYEVTYPANVIGGGDTSILANAIGRQSFVVEANLNLGAFTALTLA